MLLREGKSHSVYVNKEKRDSLNPYGITPENELGSSEIIKPMIKAELSGTFKTIEGLYEQGGEIEETNRKIAGVGPKMKHDKKKVILKTRSFKTLSLRFLSVMERS